MNPPLALALANKQRRLRLIGGGGPHGLGCGGLKRAMPDMLDSAAR